VLILLLVERRTSCTSILLVVERDTTFMSTLLVVAASVHKLLVNDGMLVKSIYSKEQRGVC
jgi:hypothetical protein